MRLARPGGWVASLEPDTEYALCYPAHSAYTRIRELFRAAFGRNGADPLIGRRLADMYRQAGLRDIGVEARARVCPPDDHRRPAARPAPRGRQPGPGQRILVVPHLSFLTWGRKPAGGKGALTGPIGSRRPSP